MEIKELQKKAAYIRLNALMAIQKSGMQVTGASMSTVEILTALYYGTLNRQRIVTCDAKKPGWDGQDYVVLAKGAAATVHYSILADLGFFDNSELDYFAQVNSLLQAKPVAKIPGVIAPVLNSTHGLSIAVGLAMALKMDRVNNKVYTVMDVSDIQNGQVLEAATAAAHYKLDNLVLFVDDAQFQNDGTVKSVMDTGFLQAKLDSFGWRVIQVTNGHDFDEILDAVVKTLSVTRRPICVWCHTVSGKGIDFAERKHGYFNAELSEPELQAIKPKLKELYESND